MTRWKTDASLTAEGRERVFLMVTLLGQAPPIARQSNHANRQDGGDSVAAGTDPARATCQWLAFDGWIKQIEAGLGHNERVTDVWHPDPQGRSLRVIAGAAARVHIGPPAIRISNGATVTYHQHRAHDEIVKFSH